MKDKILVGIEGMCYCKTTRYGISRVPECLSLCTNWLAPLPLPQASAVPPPLPPEPKEGGQRLRAGERAGGANSDDWRENQALGILCYGTFTLCTFLHSRSQG
jgi:hypothetical protein